MKKLSAILLSLIVLLMLNGCATLYVNSTINPGVQEHVRKEMVRNEQKRRKDNRAINKGHRIQKQEIKKAQQQDWK